MSKSFSAKVMSDLLELFAVFMEKNGEKLIEEALRKGEKPTPPPVIPRTRIVDQPDGRVFYANEKSQSGITVFYLHGGAYFMDITRSHWMIIETLIREADVRMIVPAYRRLPFATWKEAFDFVVPLYREYCEKNPDQKIIVMGDSAGGGLSLVDLSMDNEQIKEYIPRDPFLTVPQLLLCAGFWKGDLDVHDWHVSPIYGDLKGIRNVTLFTGTDEILYPDSIKMFGMLDEDPTNELIVAEEMNHVYPLFPIPEARPAVEKIISVVTR